MIDRDSRRSLRRYLRLPRGVRARLLAIVLIPSIALLGIGVGAAYYLVRSAEEAQDWADLAGATCAPAINLVRTFQVERQASLLHLDGDPTGTQNLPAARLASDAAMKQIVDMGDAAAELRPDLAGDIEGFQALYAEMPKLRQAIDVRALPTAQAFEAYSNVIDTIVAATLLAADVAPGGDIAVELYKSVHPLRAAEALAKATALGVTGELSGEFGAAELARFAEYIGDARGELGYGRTVLTGDEQAVLQRLLEGPEYRRLVEVQNAVLERGVVPGSSGRTAEELPVGTVEWQQASSAVTTGLLALWEQQATSAQNIAKAEGDETSRNAFLGGLGVLLVAGLAFGAAALLARRFVQRMRRLRGDTLELADKKLPEIMRAIGSGAPFDPDAQVERLEYGLDEVGQVADAFNRAHRAAVDAAVAESKTRSGVSSVFLNMAYRSQAMVHQQLVLLDRAERDEENPDRLEMLFTLDHLATRVRRNAENLVILGGEQPGRRWRNPVPLVELVRGAVAESADYQRIHTAKLPDVRIIGPAVGDLIHLLAELTDNATAFSPTETRVEISAALVGRGIALEIRDQGIGLSNDELAERNATLANPPDFSVADLSGDARLGLFVVGRLATRHRVSVRLAHSDYGGIKAIVIVPSSLIATGWEPPTGAQELVGVGSNGDTASRPMHRLRPDDFDPPRP
ncbi:nitrate- and nitrite sensing domain-containing protein [Nocardia sp. NPDC057353]|uniref:sensor histidine kinase n=1 Tax=Nocardia sp. NPDC057353 TaxID=3346104 RepID=UPI00363BE731